MLKLTKPITLEILARMMAEGFHGVDSQFDGINTRLDVVDTRLDGVEIHLSRVELRLDDTNKRLGKVETKLDRALYREISRHDSLIHQLAVKTHVKLEY